MPPPGINCDMNGDMGSMKNAANIGRVDQLSILQRGGRARGGPVPGQVLVNQRPGDNSVEANVQQLQQAKRTLERSITSSNYQNHQIVRILKANPQVMAASIKQRQVWIYSVSK